MNPGPAVQPRQDSPGAWLEHATHAAPDAHPEAREVFAQLLQQRHAATPGGTPAESETQAAIRGRASSHAVPATRKKVESRAKPADESTHRTAPAAATAASKSLASPVVEREATARRAVKSGLSPAPARPEDSTPAYALLWMANPTMEPPPARAASDASAPAGGGEDPEAVADGEEGAPRASDSRLLGGRSMGQPVGDARGPDRAGVGTTADTNGSPLSPLAGNAEAQNTAPARESPEEEETSGLAAKAMAIASASPRERGGDPSESLALEKESATLSAAASAEATDLPSTPNHPDRNDQPRDGAPDSRRDGMTDAPSDMSMKMARKMNQFALLNEQYLPPQSGGLTATSATAVSGGARRADHAPADPPASGGPSMDFLATPAPASSAISEIPTAPAGDKTSQVEKLTGLFTGKSIELKQASAVQMTAVLRPDAHTELHVQVRLEPTGVEIYARCDQGDAQALGAQWDQIQQALAPQGIRLANLNEPPPGSARSDAFTGASGQPYQQPSDRQEARRQETPARFEEEPAFPSTASALSTRRHSGSTPPAGRRWESWA